MTRRSFLAHPVARFAALALCAAVLLAALVGLLVGREPAALIVALGCYLTATVLAAAFLQRAYPHSVLGWCNAVTLARLLMACALLAPLLAPASPAPIIAVATLALILDGLDGWLARWQGTESEFGARFDMEVDSALGLVLAMNAWAADIVGPVVLLLGLPRYLFGMAAWCWRWIDRPLPPRRGRKFVCVVQILALIALQLPAMSGLPAQWIILLALAALAWSFGRDLLWLWRRRS